jgi:hypothetical protein
MNELAVLEAENFAGNCHDMSRCRHIALMTSPSTPMEAWLPLGSPVIRADTPELTPFFPCNYSEINVSGAELGLLHPSTKAWPRPCGEFRDISGMQTPWNLRFPEHRNFNLSKSFAVSSD